MCFFYRDVQSGSPIEPVDMITLQGAVGGDPQQEKIYSYVDPIYLYNNTQSMQPSSEPDPLPIYEHLTKQ